MTGEEMERAIEFILQNQTTLEEHIKEAHERINQSNERIEQVNRNLGEQIAEVNRNLGERIAEVNRNLGERIDELNRVLQLSSTFQSQLNERMMAAITTLAEGQQRLAESQRELSESQRELSESQRHTDQKLDALIDIVRERFEGKDGAA